MDRTTGRMREDQLRCQLFVGAGERWIEQQAEVNCLWVLERQMDRATRGMNEDLLRLTVCGCLC